MNVPFTEEELARIKEQIKLEILNEMKPATTPWERLKLEVARRVRGDKLRWYNTAEQTKILNVVSAVIRTRFGISHMSYLAENKFDEALEIAHQVLDLMKVGERG